MKLIQWLDKMEYELLQGTLDLEVTDVIYDSRKAKEQTVFVCMMGSRIDSHDFIDDVVQKGVKALVIEKDMENLPKGVTVIRVDNSRNALALLSAARFDYPAEKMVTIGVTGTKGKTTTTHMIKAILETAGKKVGMIGTNGAVIGEETYPTRNTTPESYELQEYFSKMTEAGCEYMIMEVSSQGLKMHRVDGIFFDYGLFTNISPDHIGPDEHADFEEYLYYKSQLLNRCKTGIVNRDDPHYEEIVRRASCECHTFSLDGDAGFMAKDIRYVAEPDFVGLDFKVTGEYELELKVNIPGRFNVYNALAAVSVCSFLGLPKDKICHALEHLSVNGRMEIVYASPKCTVIVDYAHNAVSMESLLKTLRDYNPKRLVCVFGCGGNRSKDRRYSMGEIGGRLADLCIITADNSRFEKVEDIIADIRGSIEKTGGAFIEIPDRREAIEYSIIHAQPGDMIAVIGKGHEDYQEINGVRYPFLDRAVIEETVKKL
ncbi:UDP-N-acetylmuramoyl-L-alanyl-D-glutamate--2,6-diaminopimelate ligase [Clostridium sp. MCC353]|uniref:UDP-N-acetylmuramoyl-L-alanyl-D-glutamate--2, 6-diaminopimelate ligase n=1 Tax=Clostridium sp. MCC353 TaxID=2592646 RepID=UPI001C02B58C|nr:UDP-N-acetylmuramoyl-L-alanyl-D-glutamate--2,6-diaminopimelate ligase [Clostridium sp. MCC353]MBT9779290.1 UDP-N-acetylmuramoyl-L-alanyl-D-glutamate--2,6-diaminopimelate ligase [Clostridium sp. MCC353]